jgi:hypothetical protein
MPNMTKDELSRLAAITQEIELIKKQISGTSPKYLVDFVKASSPEFPYTQHNVKVAGNDYDAYYSRVNRLQKRLSNKLNELMDEKDRVMEYIETVNDSTMRMILSLKYVNGLTFEEIGNEIGYSRVWVKKKHSKFFAKM